MELSHLKVNDHKGVILSNARNEIDNEKLNRNFSTFNKIKLLQNVKISTNKTNTFNKLGKSIEIDKSNITLNNNTNTLRRPMYKEEGTSTKELNLESFKKL